MRVVYVRVVCVWFMVCIWCVYMHMCMCVVCVHICVLKVHINTGDRVAQWLRGFGPSHIHRLSSWGMKFCLQQVVTLEKLMFLPWPVSIFCQRSNQGVDILRPFKYWPCCHRKCHFWVLSLEKWIVSCSFEKRQKVGEKEDTGVMGKDRVFSGRVHLVIQCPG